MRPPSLFPPPAHERPGAVDRTRVLLRGQATGVAIGPPLTVEREQLVEIAQAIRAGLDAVAA